MTKELAYWGTAQSNPHLQDNITKVLEHFRKQEPAPLIIHVQHHSTRETSPMHPSNPGVEFYEFSKPLAHEMIIKKSVNSAFIGTNLEQVLREHDIRKLYCIGMTVDQCVSTTVRMASNMQICDRGDEKGEVIFIGDAAAAYGYDGLDATLIHRVHEATLAHEFCTVIQTADLFR